MRTYDANGCITSCKGDMSGLEPCDKPATHHVELTGYGKPTGARVVRGLTGRVHDRTRGGNCQSCAETLAARINARLEKKIS